MPRFLGLKVNKIRPDVFADTEIQLKIRKKKKLLKSSMLVCAVTFV